MPIKRKICDIGHGRAIFLPSGWLDSIEDKYGQGSVKAVNLEVDGSIIVTPIIIEKKES